MIIINNRLKENFRPLNTVSKDIVGLRVPESREPHYHNVTAPEMIYKLDNNGQDNFSEIVLNLLLQIRNLNYNQSFLVSNTANLKQELIKQLKSHLTNVTWHKNEYNKEINALQKNINNTNFFLNNQNLNIIIEKISSSVKKKLNESPTGGRGNHSMHMNAQLHPFESVWQQPKEPITRTTSNQLGQIFSPITTEKQLITVSTFLRQRQLLLNQSHYSIQRIWGGKMQGNPLLNIKPLPFAQFSAYSGQGYSDLRHLEQREPAPEYFKQVPQIPAEAIARTITHHYFKSMKQIILEQKQLLAQEVTVRHRLLIKGLTDKKLLKSTGLPAKLIGKVQDSRSQIKQVQFFSYPVLLEQRVLQPFKSFQQSVSRQYPPLPQQLTERHRLLTIGFAEKHRLMTKELLKENRLEIKQLQLLPYSVYQEKEALHQRYLMQQYGEQVYLEQKFFQPEYAANQPIADAIIQQNLQQPLQQSVMGFQQSIIRQYRLLPQQLTERYRLLTKVLIEKHLSESQAIPAKLSGNRQGSSLETTQLQLPQYLGHREERVLPQSYLQLQYREQKYLEQKNSELKYYNRPISDVLILQAWQQSFLGLQQTNVRKYRLLPRQLTERHRLLTMRLIEKHSLDYQAKLIKLLGKQGKLLDNPLESSQLQALIGQLEQRTLQSYLKLQYGEQVYLEKYPKISYSSQTFASAIIMQQSLQQALHQSFKNIKQLAIRQNRLLSRHLSERHRVLTKRYIENNSLDIKTNWVKLPGKQQNNWLGIKQLQFHLYPAKLAQKLLRQGYLEQQYGKQSFLNQRYSEPGYYWNRRFTDTITQHVIKKVQQSIIWQYRFNYQQLTASSQLLRKGFLKQHWTLTKDLIEKNQIISQVLLEKLLKKRLLVTKPLEPAQYPQHRENLVDTAYPEWKKLKRGNLEQEYASAMVQHHTFKQEAWPDIINKAIHQAGTINSVQLIRALQLVSAVETERTSLPVRQRAFQPLHEYLTSQYRLRIKRFSQSNKLVEQKSTFKHLPPLRLRPYSGTVDSSVTVDNQDEPMQLLSGENTQFVHRAIPQPRVEEKQEVVKEEVAAPSFEQVTGEVNYVPINFERQEGIGDIRPEKLLAGLDIESIISMNSLADKVYDKIEKKLVSERRRRGL